SVTLALSDFISFILSLYIALGVLSLIVEKNDYLLLTNEIDGWFLLHWILGVCCVGWYSVRLRHYFYRKTFWFELKEILRTLVIF
ncbi:UDP-phosphate galactose phosphotransferase, partial [Klebsiella pneumoniae]|nr:UDP-phosphate galactose phosphotransferase [Klebsiella pneumoniae]